MFCFVFFFQNLCGHRVSGKMASLCQVCNSDLNELSKQMKTVTQEKLRILLQSELQEQGFFEKLSV